MCLTRGRRRDREKRGELDATGKREQRGWWKLSRTRRWMQRPGERVRERCTACILKRHFMVTADWSSPFRHAHRAANGKKVVRLNVPKESRRLMDIYAYSVDDQDTFHREPSTTRGPERQRPLARWRKQEDSVDRCDEDRYFYSVSLTCLERFLWDWRWKSRSTVCHLC